MRLFISILSLSLFLVQPLWAEDTGEGASVLVVYNSRMPESKRVAEYYAEKRHVPKDQLVGLHLSKFEVITRDDYNKELADPLWKVLLDRKLITLKPDADDARLTTPTVAASKIRYAVLCYGVPLKISSSSEIHEENLEKMPAELRRNEAAVDNELALLPMRGRQVRLAGPINSPFYGTTNAAQLDPTNGLLMVTRLDGPSEQIAKGLVDKALEAEKVGLWGRSYIDLRSIKDPQYKTGDDWIRKAGEVTSRLGWETVTNDAPETFGRDFPMSQIAFYFGWYDGNVSGPFTWGKTEFMPGAFAYHLHSYSANTVRSDSANWVGPFLARGVTATMGCVYEPYLGGTPDVGMFAIRWLNNRFSFGEAAYAAATTLSWQLTVVGDPLYRPMNKLPQVRHADLIVSGSQLLEWSHLKIVDLNLVTGKAPALMLGYLAQTPMTKKSSVLLEKEGDLLVLEKQPANAITAYEKALKLDVTPKQRLRLLLEQADLLAQTDKTAEAVDAYLELEKRYPDYPGLTTIYQKLLPLAKKLNRTELVEKCQQALEKKP